MRSPCGIGLQFDEVGLSTFYRIFWNEVFVFFDCTKEDCVFGLTEWPSATHGAKLFHSLVAFDFHFVNVLGHRLF